MFYGGFGPSLLFNNHGVYRYQNTTGVSVTVLAANGIQLILGHLNVGFLVIRCMCSFARVDIEIVHAGAEYCASERFGNTQSGCARASERVASDATFSVTMEDDLHYGMQLNRRKSDES
ncbi:hypothetical protein BS47DRAFT_1338986 [Hydnum rufescens UP504]|uniref:Uncharacterized protein n=1 Tax=Hydnum rufescens UP504 TaxID=1448309 RepID=A0A9P6B595_9AGAM|nr:hypothetical protein BS47DRAFT_1338986 [Hydnum rufescens UP504]